MVRDRVRAPEQWRQWPKVLLDGLPAGFQYRPERKKRKKTQEMLATLRNGDKVVTSGGLHGKVVGVTDQIIQLRIADGVKIEVSRSAVSSKLSD